jgi:hypothetical protein
VMTSMMEQSWFEFQDVRKRWRDKAGALTPEA